MTLIRRSTPLVDLVSFQDAMERLFDERFFRPVWIGNGERLTAPALDLYTTPEAVIAKVALPGVKPEDVDVTIGDDVVTISGAFKEEKETTDAGYVHARAGASQALLEPLDGERRVGGDDRCQLERGRQELLVRDDA